MFKMELKITDIVEAAGRIIIESGTDSLSIKELADEMGINTSLLDSYFEKDYDIQMLLLKSLENDIKQLIIETRIVHRSPEEDLQLLFQNMHELLKLKPYYLSVIFSTELKGKNSELQKVLLRIKISVRIYLLEVINQGKKETVFKTRQTSRILVTNILGSFRLFMNEQRVINKMVKDLEILKVIND
jgi:AcrR family transcriptional regulator